MKQELPCIICPMSCRLEVEREGDQILSISGNSCPRGAAYAQKELTHPMRMLTTTIRIMHAALPLLPVISAKEVPKEKIFDIMEAVKHVKVNAPIKCGCVVVPNVANTGIDLIAARTLDEMTDDETGDLPVENRHTTEESHTEHVRDYDE